MPVLIMGSGPAAWSLAAAVTAEGVDCLLVAPAPHAEWPQTYGMWTDQWSEPVVQLTGLQNPWLHRWDRVVAISDREHVVGRGYGVLHNERLLAGLRTQAERTGRMSVRVGSIVAVEPTDAECTVHVADGDPITARLVFDGTGAASRHIRRENGPTTLAVQTAFGRVVRAHNVPFDQGTCVLMDWRGPGRRDPSFLYALPFGGGEWLFEETSLARRGGMDHDELRRRLQERLDSLGVEIVEERRTEEVRFPMDVPLPRAGQRVVGVGAAASLVHPATGYSVGASLRAAGPLARVVSASLGLPVEEAAARCWTSLWDDDRRKARRLETFGLGRLLTMDQRDTQAFFETFFDLPTSQTAVYLGGEAGPQALRKVMWDLFRRAPGRLQIRLVAGNPLPLVRSLLR